MGTAMAMDTPMATKTRSAPPRAIWNGVAAAALLLAAPFAYFQAAANAGMDAPQWARSWNGFRLADEALGRLAGDPQKPEAGLALGPGAAALARAAYAREPMATDALFVLELARTPLAENYRAGPIAKQGAALDKRNGLLQLLMIADAAGRENFPDLFAHADLLAAAHPNLADAVAAPLFERLGDPAAMPLIADALAREPRWAGAFKRTVPSGDAALRNYLALRRKAGERWESDGWLIEALANRGMYRDAIALWRQIAGPDADRFGFATNAEYAPVGWRFAESGDGAARIGEDGAMFVWMQRGADGELARQLLELPPGRYVLETKIESRDADPPLTVAQQCAGSSPEAARPLTERTEFVVGDAGCEAHWLVLGATALDSRRDLEATLSGWRLSKVP
jgi:hypothetical protein